jgi:hypothetical protein
MRVYVSAPPDIQTRGYRAYLGEAIPVIGVLGTKTGAALFTDNVEPFDPVKEGIL